MNAIDFNKNNFPLTTNVLDFLQSSTGMIEKITALVGGNYILSGCVVAGQSIGAGFVVVNGEIMPFDGGPTQQYVRVVSTETTVNVQDGSYKKTTKKLVLGGGTGQMLWAGFRRATDLLSKIEGKLAKGKIKHPIGTYKIDYTGAGGLPSNFQAIDLTSIITEDFSTVVLDISYWWTGQGTYGEFYFSIIDETPQAPTKINRKAYPLSGGRETVELLTLPVPMKSFFIQMDNAFNSDLKILLTVIGYY